jgi:serine phosphatase RsbU (regulator of sigma subunit)
LWLDVVRSRFWDLFLTSNVLTSLAPFVAFMPWSGVKPNKKPLAAMCMAVGASTASFFVLLIVYRFTRSHVFSQWANNVALAQAIVLLCLIAVLLGLLFRDQQHTAQERALLAGEMQAARNVQQYLIPDHLPDTPGLSVQSEFHPAREVGGDFFQVLPQPDGSTLIFIGDVAGKGIEAGMLATLILGAIRTAAAFTSDPERILCLLNDRLRGRGLVTCLALRIEQDGRAAIINAGHLPPYLNGSEMALEGALPLGALDGIAFPVSLLQLVEGDTLILITDGVSEAQNSQGELFGFERIQQILGAASPGASLADAAQAFGQEDDITVLSLTFAPIGVVHA